MISILIKKKTNKQTNHNHHSMQFFKKNLWCKLLSPHHALKKNGFRISIQKQDSLKCVYLMIKSNAKQIATPTTKVPNDPISVVDQGNSESSLSVIFAP